MSMIALSLFLTCKAVSASFTLNKKGYIVYFVIVTLCRMAFRELWKVVIIFLMNANDYYNSSKCYSDYYLMWMANLKKTNHALELMSEREFIVVLVKN